jgi:hypothetical protein
VVMLPSRAGWPRLERLASWKLTATSSRRPLLPSLRWLLTRCRCGAARRGRGSPFSLRLEHHRAYHQRIDHMLATDPQ